MSEGVTLEQRPTGSEAARSVATLLVGLALFSGQIVGGLYEGIGRPLPDAYPILSGIPLALSVIAWFSLYSQRHRVQWVMDMGWFLLAAWIAVIPYYVLKREGRAGFARIGLFCLTWFAAWAAGWAVKVWARVLSGGG